MILASDFASGRFHHQCPRMAAIDLTHGKSLLILIFRGFLNVTPIQYRVQGSGPKQLGCWFIRTKICQRMLFSKSASWCVCFGSWCCIIPLMSSIILGKLKNQISQGLGFHTCKIRLWPLSTWAVCLAHSFCGFRCGWATLVFYGNSVYLHEIS